MDLDFSDFQSSQKKEPPSSLKERLDSIWEQKKPSIRVFASLKNRSKKITALKEIGQSEDKNFSKLLLELLEKEKDAELQKEAILALGRIKDQKAIPELAVLLFSSLDSQLRQEIVYILGEMKPNREILDTLEHILVWDQDLKVRQKSIEALGKLRSFLSIFTLEKIFLEEKNPQIKKMICWTLPQIEPEEARDFFSNQISKESDPEVIKEIIWVLANIGTIEHFNEILKDFENLSLSIQKILVWSLVKIENKRAHQELINLVARKSLSDQIILELVQVLGRFKIRKSLPVLVKILREKNNNIKKHSIWALVSFKDEKILLILKKRLKKEKSPDVRDELKKALEYIALFV